MVWQILIPGQNFAAGYRSMSRVLPRSLGELFLMTFFLAPQVSRNVFLIGLLYSMLSMAAAQIASAQTQPAESVRAQGMAFEWYKEASSEVRRLQQQRKYGAAQQKNNVLLERVISEFGPRSFDTAIVLNRKGHILKSQRKLAKAVEAYAESLAIMREVFGPVHGQVAVVLTSIASTNGALKKLEEARRQYAEALQIAEQASGRASDAYLQVLNSLVVHHANYDDQSVAGRLLDDVIGLTRKIKGETSTALLKAYKNKANFLAKQKKMRDLHSLFTALLRDAETKNGADHTFTIQLLANFAKLYRDTRNYELSERLYRQVIERSTKTLGANHRFTVANTTLLADVLHVRGKNEEAVVHYANGLQRWDQAFGREDTRNVQLYLRYGLSLRRIGRFADAEKAYWQSLEIGERALGKHSKLNHHPYLYLAGLKRELGQYDDAEKFYKEALQRARKAYGEKHSQVALTMENLAVLYGDMARHEDSGKFAARALELFEENYGVNSPSLVNVLNNLAMVFHATNRSDNALQYLTRALNIVNANETMRKDPIVPVLLDNLASVFSRRGKPETALKHTRNAYDRFVELYGLDNARTATAALNLGALHAELKQFDKALPRYQQALKSFDTIYGRKHRSFGNGLAGVGRALTGLGRLQEAMQYQRRALSVYEDVLPEGHPQVIYQLRVIADLLVKKEKFLGAFRTYQRAAKYIEARLSEGRSSADTIQVYSGIITNADRLRQGDVQRDELLAITFRAAQRLGGATVAGALAKMSARFAAGEDALGVAVRKQQDLVGRLEVVDAGLTTALGNSDGERNQARVVQLREERSKLREGLVSLEERLRKQFPRYAELSQPHPLTIERLRKQLRPDETYIQYVVNESGVFVWLIDGKDALWQRLAVSRGQLRQLVGTLRCGLDASLWDDIKCFDLTGQAPSGPDGSVLPFDLHAAHALYSKLLGRFKNRIRKRHLLIVAPDVLAALPFQVLVRRRPRERFVKDTLDLREVTWLVKSHPITILPAASSLGALRTYAGKSAADQPYFGVGDPVLTGNGSCPQVVVPQSCELAPPLSKDVQIALAGSIKSFYRSGTTGDANVSQLCPLPDTAHELRCVAKSLGAEADTLRLQDAANEAVIKSLSESGKLSKYRVVHFATHGLLAAETKSISRSLNEPSLVLTPPAAASPQDDGLLTASEVAQLKLDADWVILSACNTASGGAPGQEALSGLARAFFYAGSRAVLVSHWPVYSSAAVKLTTTAMAEMRRKPDMGRAAAMRFSMSRLIDTGKAHEVHPAYWAPFVVVGEGA